MLRRSKKPLQFATPETVAANAVLDDYDVERPWKVLEGAAAQSAINAAIEVEEVEFTSRHACLKDHMVLDALNNAFVFVQHIPGG